MAESPLSPAPVAVSHEQPEGTPPTFLASSPALCFHVHATCGLARAGTMHLPHGPVRTPVFMPVGTKGTVKALLPQQLLCEETLPGAQPEIVLANTYHCALQPGTELLEEFGGLHFFMAWPRNLLTDSGGFQMVSLLKLAKITEEGVTFRSHIDDAPLLLTPEQSVAHQNRIGADIMMQLDDVVSSVADDDARFEEAMQRSVRWLDRCVAAHARPDSQSLFAILQGGLDTSAGGLRERCMAAMLARDMPGYAIGGLSGGEAKDAFWRVVAASAAALPRHKPRYVMGVGYPLDLVVCVALGCDMFDCVYPTRTARFGVALTPDGVLKIRANKCATDGRPVDAGCPCLACRRFTRASLHQHFKHEDGLGPQLLSLHNIAHMMRLMRGMRQAILDGAFPAFVRGFLARMFPDGGVPAWAVEALAHAGIEVAGSVGGDASAASAAGGAAGAAGSNDSGGDGVKAEATVKPDGEIGHGRSYKNGGAAGTRSRGGGGGSGSGTSGGAPSKAKAGAAGSEEERHSSGAAAANGAAPNEASTAADASAAQSQKRPKQEK